MKYNKATLLCALAALAAACADEGATPDYGPGQTTSQASPATSAKATRGKAEAIARLFAPYRATDESGRSSRTNGWYALEGGNRMIEKTPYRFNAQMITGFSNYTPR